MAFKCIGPFPPCICPIYDPSGTLYGPGTANQLGLTFQQLFHAFWNVGSIRLVCKATEGGGFPCELVPNGEGCQSGDSYCSYSLNATVVLQRNGNPTKMSDLICNCDPTYNGEITLAGNGSGSIDFSLDYGTMYTNVPLKCCDPVSWASGTFYPAISANASGNQTCTYPQCCSAGWTNVTVPNSGQQCTGGITFLGVGTSYVYCTSSPCGHGGADVFSIAITAASTLAAA